MLKAVGSIIVQFIAPVAEKQLLMKLKQQILPLL
jgi:hypothetical protein